MKRFQYVLDEAVVEEIIKMKGSERDALLHAFQWLADNPHDEGEESELADSLRPVFSKRFRDWLVTYWPDDGACELRVIKISNLDI
jgi:hypothetical protein